MPEEHVCKPSCHNPCLLDGDAEPARPDYKQRVVDEKAELEQRRGKLLLFIGGPVFASLDEYDKALLTHQAATMRTYATILAERIARF